MVVVAEDDCPTQRIETTSGYSSIDVRQLRRAGWLSPYQTFVQEWSRDGEVVGFIRTRTEEEQLILTYGQRSTKEEWKERSYSIPLDWTSCHLGGKRPWFRCPVRGCSRRVAILYAGENFACRSCFQLSYQSQRETDYDRAARRADKIREKLEWETGCLNGHGCKPKGMHMNTFERLTAQHDAFVQSLYVRFMRRGRRE